MFSVIFSVKTVIKNDTKITEKEKQILTFIINNGPSKVIEISNALSFSITTIKNILYKLVGDDLISSSGTIKDKVQILPQVVAQLFSIPWGHHRYIIDKCKDVEEALFFVNKILENNWSRDVLLNFLDTNLYKREGKAITNFKEQLPEEKSDLAQQITKDPYNFDFLAIRQKYDEKELKDALIDNIQKFLLELGSGFAFVGRETRLLVGETELYNDLLFYNIRMHAYVVIEVKNRKFKPEDLGQLGAYVSSVNHLLKGENDNDTIGLLICKDKDEIVAKYSLENYNIPIGVSSFELEHFIPENFKGSLPTIEEIENELKD